MIPLVCIDVDGTLVGSSGTVLPVVWAAAARARDAGVHLVLCSGRPAFGVTGEYATRLDAGGWHIFQNGASIMRPSTGETRSQPIPDDTIRMLVERAGSTGRILELYTDTAYAVESTSPRARAHAALLGVPFAPRPFGSLDGAIVRAQWLMSRDEEAEVVAEPHPGLELLPSTSPVMPDTVFGNMTRLGVSKASAVREVAAACGVPLARVMYVGDGLNDVGAMQIVGWPVAMANAAPEVHAVVSSTVGDVDDAGVVQALEMAIAE